MRFPYEIKGVLVDLNKLHVHVYDKKYEYNRAVRLFTINRFTSGDVIHFIHKIFCLTRNGLLFQYKTV